MDMISEPAAVVRNYVGSRVGAMECELYTKISHFPFVIIL